MRAAAPMPVVHHGVPPSQVDPLLQQASHVFLRVDAVKHPLVPPYEGPFSVVSRTDKTFVILHRGKPVAVSVDRLKPAAFLPEVEAVPSSPPTSAGSTVPPSPTVDAVPVLSSSPGPVITRSGRVSRPQDIFQA